MEMFGSSNQSPAPADNSQANNPGALNSFTMDPPHKDAAAAPPLPPEPTGSPVPDATSAPHVDESTASNGTPPVASPPPTDLPAPAPADSLANLENSVKNPAVDDSKDEAAPEADHSELLDIKTQALTQLSPLISHLDQTPEDKFKTLMMMIQANDNQELIKEAYAAAQQITDEKAKSQALLDIVNEINYFTQKSKK